MAGWIRADRTLVHVGVAEAVWAEDCGTCWALKMLPQGAPDDFVSHTLLRVDYGQAPVAKVTGEQAKAQVMAEFDRVAGWLAEGGEGVYVVGEGAQHNATHDEADELARAAEAILMDIDIGDINDGDVEALADAIKAFYGGAR